MRNLQDGLYVSSLRTEEREKDLIDIEDLRKTLPKVGDILMKIPTVGTFDEERLDCPIKSEKCTVTYVDVEHLWYQVRFDYPNTSGTIKSFLQCYKLPEGVVWEEDKVFAKGGSIACQEILKK